MHLDYNQGEKTVTDLTKRINQLMEAMHQLQLENDNLHESLRKLQVGTPMELEEKKNSPPASTNVLHVEPGSSSTSMEPKISLPNKFDGTRKHYRGFINQIKLIIQL